MQHRISGAIVECSRTDPCTLDPKTIIKLGPERSTAALAGHKVGDMVTAARHVNLSRADFTITDF